MQIINRCHLNYSCEHRYAESFDGFCVETWIYSALAPLLAADVFVVCASNLWTLNNFCQYYFERGTNVRRSLTNWSMGKHVKLKKIDARTYGCGSDWAREFVCTCKAVVMSKSCMIKMSPPIALSEWQGTSYYVEAMTSDVIVMRTPSHASTCTNHQRSHKCTHQTTLQIAV